MVAEPGIRRITVTTLGELLDLRAAELGDHLAMVFPDHQVTYAGLAERADFFARGLLAAGLKPGETVGILLPNCVDAIAALFGAAKAGLYPVPVNARYKSLELADPGVLLRHDRGVLVPVAELLDRHPGTAGHHRRPPHARHGVPRRRSGHRRRPAA